MTTPSFQLKSYSISELLDQTFRFYRAHFLRFMGIAALLLVPYAMLAGLNQYATVWAASNGTAAASTALISVGLSLTLSGVQTLLIQPLINGAITRSIHMQRTTNELPSILGSYRIGWRTLLHLILGSILVAIALAVVTLPITMMLSALLFAFVFSSSLPASSFTGFSLPTIIGVVLTTVLIGLATQALYARLVLYIQSVVIEGYSGVDAITRSWNLTKGSFWYIFRVLMLMFLLSVLISSIPTGLIMLSQQLVTLGTSAELLQSVGVFLSTLGAVFTMPLQLILSTFLYYVLRVRNEGYDMEQSVNTMVRV